MAWRLATWPTRRCPSSVKATTDGVVRAPSEFGMTSACPPSIVAATTELVVPRSIPTALAMVLLSLAPTLRVRSAVRAARERFKVGRRLHRPRVWRMPEIEETPDRDGAFPRLNEDQIARLSVSGT